MGKTDKEILLTKRPKTVLSTESATSTGSTLLNLATGDRPDVSLMQGGYYFLVGDSSSGKTWLTLSIFAEASLSDSFEDYDFVYDDVEGGALMDMEHYFGSKMMSRVRPPAWRMPGKEPANSETVEDFYFHIGNLIKKGKPFIYVLDSQDALDSEIALKKYAKQTKAKEEDKEEKGSYGTDKAKYHSEHIRAVIAGLKRTRSILIIISQTRDNLGFGFEKKTRSGGKALKFYANVEWWTSVAGKITKTVNGKDRTIGLYCQVEVKKNRVSGKVGKDRAVILPIYYGYGIDDIGSCVDYLIDEKVWLPVEGKKSIYNAKGIMFSGSRDKIVAYIEEENLENKLKEITARTWREIEDACMPVRKSRYN